MKTLTLTAAFLITQFLLVVTVYLGVLFLSWGEDGLHSFHFSKKPATSKVTRYLLGFSLLSLACLIFTEEMVSVSQPIFNNVYLPSLTKDDSFLTVFLLDIFGASALMVVSGGGKNSPFSSLLFGLPAISIFLKEPPSRFLIYTILTAIMFWVFFKPLNRYGKEIQSNSNYDLSYKVVTLLTLGVSTLIGYTTLKI